MKRESILTYLLVASLLLSFYFAFKRQKSGNDYIHSKIITTSNNSWNYEPDAYTYHLCVPDSDITDSVIAGKGMVQVFLYAVTDSIDSVNGSKRVYGYIPLPTDDIGINLNHVMISWMVGVKNQVNLHVKSINRVDVHNPGIFTIKVVTVSEKP